MLALFLLVAEPINPGDYWPDYACGDRRAMLSDVSDRGYKYLSSGVWQGVPYEYYHRNHQSVVMLEHRGDALCVFDLTATANRLQAIEARQQIDKLIKDIDALTPTIREPEPH